MPGQLYGLRCPYLKMRFCVALCIVIAASVSLAVAQEACSGHGKLLPSGACECDSARPAPESKGWTGSDCAIPVFGTTLDGEDMMDWCRTSDHCDAIAGGQWACFYTNFPWQCVVFGLG